MNGYRSRVSNAEAIMVEHGIREQFRRRRHTAIGKRCSQSQRVLHMLVMIFFIIIGKGRSETPMQINSNTYW